ncbi:scaffold protein [Perkinsela sp. CCAP 1560/4]|nr:scaffold protein [Perkinsela sp. CCAP 1560/4]|eukprot:KNH05732.1 scaffold protein [Perkinsela sp. CCAP 1560/4]
MHSLYKSTRHIQQLALPRQILVKSSVPLMLSAMRTKYSESVIEHYNNPRNVGSLDKNDPDVGSGLCGAPECGDLMKMDVKVNDEGVITHAKFKTFGCGSALASSSVATEKIIGMRIDEALKISNKEIASELSLPPVKLHCSMLAEETIQAAINDVVRKKPILKTYVKKTA